MADARRPEAICGFDCRQKCVRALRAALRSGVPARTLRASRSCMDMSVSRNDNKSSAPLAFWTRRWTSNPKIVGSSPTGGVRTRGLLMCRPRPRASLKPLWHKLLRQRGGLASAAALSTRHCYESTRTRSLAAPRAPQSTARPRRTEPHSSDPRRPPLARSATQVGEPTTNHQASDVGLHHPRKASPMAARGRCRSS